MSECDGWGVMGGVWVYIVMAEEGVRFQLQEYYDVLTSASVKEKAKPLVRQFKKKNIGFIYETLVNTMQVLTGKHELPLMKFNALMATKLFFDTAEYVPLVLIEVYLLPIILEVALYRVQKRSEEGLTLYFTERGGYEATKEMKRVGFNFVLLAIEFVFMSSQVRPFRTLQNQQLREESNFAKAARLLEERGLRPTDNCKFYIPSYVAKTRKKYLKRLGKLSGDEYSDYFLKLLCDQLNLGRKAEVDTRKLLQFGDAYLTIPLLHVCEDELSNMQTNFANKKKYLALLGDFMRQGDIYAVLILTRSSFLEGIYARLQEVRGEAGLDAGEGIYPEVEASRADKRQFYVQFLKHVEIWAHCHPVDEEGAPTDAKRIVEALKTQRRFVFPANILINKIRGEMEENLKLNQKRNEKLIRLVDELSNNEDSRRRANSSLSKVSRASDPLKLNSYIEFDELEEMVLDAKKRLDLIADQKQIHPTMRALEKFSSFWRANAEKNEIQADDSADVGIVLEEGDLCAQVIDMVLPVYQLYANNRISFEEYRDRVDVLMKKEAEESENHHTSFEQAVPSSNGPIEQFDDYVEKSSLSELHSNVREASQLSLKSSARARAGGEGLKENQAILKEKEKDGSNVSFCEESASSHSQLKRISEKESLPSDSIHQSIAHSHSRNSHSHRPPQLHSRLDRSSKIQSEQSQPSMAKSREQFRQDESLRSSHSSRSGRSSRSGNKRLVERRRPPERQRVPKGQSAVSNEQSVLSGQSANYKDAIGRKNREVDEYYNQSKESFISQNSIAQRIEPRTIKLKPGVSGRSKLKGGARDSRNEDYYGGKEDSKRSLFSSKLQEGSRMSSKSGGKVQSSVEESIIRQESSIIRQSNALPSNIQPSLLSQHTITSAKPEGNPQKAQMSSHLMAELMAKYDDSVIGEPQFNPLLHSFHEEKSVELLTNPSKVTSFRECFEVNNEIILAEEGKERLLKFTKSGKIANFIDAALPAHPRSTIVDIISQRNAKRSIDSYRHLREKSRATETLSERMKSMESLHKHQRIKNIIANSRDSTPSRPLRGSRNNGSEPVSFYNDSTPTPPQLHTPQLSQTSIPQGQSASEPRLINLGIYQHYFPGGKVERLRKCMLKSKSLLLKSEEFEIGCVTSRRDKAIEISLFFTPLKGTIEDVRLALTHDHNVKARLSTQGCEEIREGQQEHISVSCEVDGVPYVLPTLVLRFKPSRSYNHHHLLLPLPLAFSKLLTFHPHSPTPHTPHDAISTGQFRLNPRLVGGQRSREALAGFQLVRKEGKVAYYGAQAFLGGKIFEVEACVSEKGVMWLQGRNMSGDHRNMKYLQFLLVTLRHIFQLPLPLPKPN